MARFHADGFVRHDDLAFVPVGGGTIRLSGTIECERQIVLEVTKFLTIVGGAGATSLVQTSWYKYRATERGRDRFRYCSPHPAHRPHHHKHVHDANGDEDQSKLITFGNDDWPTLGAVIQELRGP